jgi:peptidyl-prolyl cis-trans isomerase D
MPQNKKFLAQKEKEDRQKRIIIIATIAVLVVVIGLVVYGVVDRYIFQARTPIIELENQTITADQFEQLVRWSRRNLIIEIDQILMTFQQLGGSPEIYSYFEQQLSISISQLQQPLLVGQEVLQGMLDDIVLMVEAEKMGIVIDEDMIDQEIQEAFGYFINGTPTPQVSQELAVEVDPTSTPQTGSDNPDPTATPILVPTEYTEDLFNDNYQEFLNGLKDNGIVEKTIREIVKISLIRQALLEKVAAGVDQTQEQVWARHILVEDQQTALDIVEKLAAGEDFEALALEYSIDESNKESGGDLGWFARGRMVPAFETAAFALEVGQISDPVQTDFGWHILESLGKDDLLLDQAAYDQLKNEFFANWIQEKRSESDPYINEEWAKYVPSEPVLPLEYLNYIQSLSVGQPQVPQISPVE